MTRSQEIALGILVLVALWLASGLFRMGSQDEVIKKERPLPSVKIERSIAEDRIVYLLARGFTEADRKVDLRAEVSGRVKEIFKEDGDYVEKGETLIKLSLRDKMAKLQEAEAMVRQRQLEYDASKKLNEKDFRSDTALALSEAQLNEAQAQVAAIQREIDDTVITAPFPGILENRDVEVGAFADVGNVLCTIVDLDPLLAVVNISELEVKKIKLGQKARVRLTQGDDRIGTVTFISRVADENTRAFRVEISMENSNYQLPDGLSLEVGIPVNDTMAHGISPAILTLDTEGRIGVKFVDADNKVVFVPIKIVDSGTERIWITGLPNEVDLIVTGQEFVNDGQEVDPVREAADARPD